MMFLESLTLSPNDFQTLGVNQGLGGLGVFADNIIGFLIVFLLVFLALYVYVSLAYRGIGKKTEITNSGVAWMPFGGPIAVIFESAESHWWPFLVSVLGFLGVYIGMILELKAFISGGGGVFSVILSFLGGIAILVFAVMVIVWHWKAYEAAGKPGWFILIPVVLCILGFLLSFLSQTMGFVVYLLGILSHLVLIGITAWSN